MTGGCPASGPLTELADLAAVADLNLEADADVELVSSAGESVLAYVYDGALRVAGRDVGAGHMLVTSAGERWHLEAGSDGARVLLLRGWPLREPVANYGPFVMNTEQEIEDAIRQYQRGELVQAHSE